MIYQRLPLSAKALGNKAHCYLHFSNGTEIQVDQLLYAAGREAETRSLKLENAGLKAGHRGIVKVKDVNKDYQTEVDHIYAVGDVIGFPALASDLFRTRTCCCFTNV